jgi:murein hydrolase activator
LNTMILRRSRPADPRLLLGSALAFVLPLGANLIAVAQAPSKQAPTGQASVARTPTAQIPSPSAAPAVPAAPGLGDADRLRKHNQELDAARTQQRRMADYEAKLKGEIEALGADRSKLEQQLIISAARVRDIEAKIEALRARLTPLDDREQIFQKSLDERRTAIVEILAALQRVGRQPPPALLVRPEDALQAVRTAIALGAVVPEMRAQATALANDLADLSRVRKDIVAQRERLSRDLDQLAREQLRLNMLIDERQKKQAATEQALNSEQQHAADLARRVDNLKDLIAQLEQGLNSGSRAAHLGNLAILGDPGRLAPAVAFADMRGHLHLPVNGVSIRAFGAPNGAGGTQKGVSIATQPSAQITAPCDGWVVYAGPFRSYGQLLILNAGGGYHVLLAGMQRISVDLGQFVLTGEPVAVMGGEAQAVAAVATRSKQPVLYVEFRKDGTPIDPSPWWATTEGEKVRG